MFGKYMKTIILSCILLGGISVGFAEDEPAKKHLVSVFCTSEDIDGTVLSKWNTFSHEAWDGGESYYACSIGYTQDIDGQSRFVPVLYLPTLKNEERYLVSCENGVLKVTTAKGKALVAKLDLNTLAPGLITKKLAKQAGADQPATKPADKSPVKDQPSPPTPKAVPR